MAGGRGPGPGFATQRQRSLKGSEEPMGEWFEAKGLRIFRAYLCTDEETHPPTLEDIPREILASIGLNIDAVPDDVKKLAVPDFLVLRPSKPCFVETKLRTSADFTHCSHQFETGFNTYQWDAYKKLREAMMQLGVYLEVRIAFMHEEENERDCKKEKDEECLKRYGEYRKHHARGDVVTLDSMYRIGELLRDAPGGKGARPRVMFPWDELTDVGKLSAIRAGKYPPLPEFLQPKKKP